MSLRPCRQKRRGRFTDTGGFTLIEVLVAFTVMATLLSVLYRGVVGIRAGSSAFDDHTREEIIARKILEETLADRKLSAGTYRGIREGRRWIIVAKSIDLSGQLPKPEPDDANPKPAVPGQQSPAPENGKPATAQTETKPDWRTQRLIVRVETHGRPLEIETIRLVQAEGGR